MRKDIHTTIPIDKFLELQDLEGWRKKILRSLINSLGINALGVAVPPRWHDIRPSDIRAAKIIQHLQSEGLAGNLSIGRNIYPDEPFLHVADLAPSGHGADFFQRELTIWRAIGENLERRLWKKVGDLYFEKSFLKTSSAKKDDFLDLEVLAGFSKKQKDTMRKTALVNNQNLRWIKVSTITKHSPLNIPYQLIDPLHQKESGEPLLRWDVSTGLATASTIEEAIIKGVLEVVERDAFMINYLNKISPPLIDLQSVSLLDDKVAHITKELERYNIIPHVTLLATDFPTYVVQATLIDEQTSGPTVSVGARASFSLRTAIIDALTEALSVRLYQRSLGTKEPVKPFGRDARLIYWAMKEDASDIEFALSGPREKISSEALHVPKKIEVHEQLHTIEKYLNERGYDGYYVNITPEKIQSATGIVSVLSIIPQLQPMHLDESIPYFGGERLTAVPQRLGYNPIHALNTEPHPFP